MEPLGAFPEGEWDHYSRIFSMEEPDFSAEVLGLCSFPLENYERSQPPNPSVLYSNPETKMSSAAANSLFSCGNTFNPNSNMTSQENNTNKICCTRVHTPTSFHKSHFSSDFNGAISMSGDTSMSMDFSILEEESTGLFSQLFTDISIGTTANIGDPHTRIDEKETSDNTLPVACAAANEELKRKSHIPKPKAYLSNNSKKRPRIASDVQKKKMNVKSKKNSKLNLPPNGNDEAETNPGLEGQNLSTYSSDDDNASLGSNGGASSESKASEALNSRGKTRASRGSATDPQSLYARKRRERINERLKILQNLVPNGTKVDISTMLEEAVHYVKFLQLQIKLLSSDDLWMFAPIAYNGIDIGLNQKISMLL